MHLFSTLRVDRDGRCALLGAHHARLADAYRALGGRALDASAADLAAAVAAAAATAAAGAEDVVRCRASVDAATGRMHVAGVAVAAASVSPAVQVCLPIAVDAAHPVSAADSWRLRYKTSERAVYEEARARFGPELADVVLVNSAGEVTEGTITNVAVHRGGGRWATPPAACGLLPGLMRGALIAAGFLVEERLSVRDLEDAPVGDLVLMNALRGVFPVAVGHQGPIAEVPEHLQKLWEAGRAWL